MKKIPGFLLLNCILSMPGYSADFYVSKEGSDRNPGTKSKPFLTIQTAASVLQPGSICWISGGSYSETVRLARSGTADHPIVFKALNRSDRVVITGADPITSDSWEKVSDHVFKAKVELSMGHENQVFLDDRTLVEARWPNVGPDLLRPVLSVMDEGTTPVILVDQDLPDFDFTGAHVWIHAYRYWSDWTTKITGQPGRHSLTIENVAPFPGPRRHETAPGADFFVFGCRDALDAENEWFYDEQAKELFVYRTDGKLPQQNYELKRRMDGFDFSGLKHVKVHDITLFGTSIKTDKATEGLLLNRVQLFYPYYSSQANDYYGSQTTKGLLFSGKDCTLQNSEVAYSSGCGVILDGENNKVLNCYIHDTDFIGSYASCVQLRGKGNVISHSTLTRTGRSVIDYGDMYQSLIQHCDMSHSGLLTSDLGLTYGNVIEGGNSEVRYNLMHDNDDTHLAMGLYYDHGTQNIISHHNIVWGVSYSAFHINHYAAYHLAYHNTFISEKIGFRSSWGNQYGPDLLGCRFVNNLFQGPSETTAGNYYWSNNISGYSGFDPGHPFAAEPGAMGRGLRIDGISVTPESASPGIGAVEYPGMVFEAGHNFDHPPDMDLTRSLPLHRNRIFNSAFEHEDHLSSWIKAGAGVKVIEHPSQNHTRPDTNLGRMGSWSIELVQEGSEIAQKINVLEPLNDYTFTGHLRVDKDECVVLGVRFPDGREFLSPQVTSGSPEWRRSSISFTTGKNPSPVTVFARRLSTGEGKTYVDDFGLILK